MTARSVVPFGIALAVAGVLVTGARAPAADVEAGRRKAEACVACHGPEGNATIPGMPSLAGMPAFYTHWQLVMYRDGRRKDPRMTPVAERLSDADMADLAAYYAAQRPAPRGNRVDAARAAEGRALAAKHHCTSCHGPRLLGQQQVPRLAGQDFDYLLERLRGYKARTTSDLDGMMTMIAQSLTQEEIESLVHFMAADP
ncbi:MAG TPA: c-type cytochrome [Candidatus Tectomicrobia bacterium]|nr:c-type cytochrome [Candidatus Tectomicrobia bacterium]